MTGRVPVAGDRVEMTGLMPEDPAPLPVGSRGTVLEARPEVGQISVAWDCGSRLILLIDDPYRIV